MAAPALAALWELGAIAAGGLATIFVASPQGREATEETARATAEALAELRSGAKRRAKGKSEPISWDAAGSCTAPDCEEEMCPVCGQLPNPTLGFTPPYVPGKREPKEWETQPPLTSYQRTRRQYNGAKIFVRPRDKAQVYIDTAHKGKSAEIEVFHRHGRHLGTICPHCGHPRKPPDPSRWLRR